ncbi:MAG: anti-sigma factor [Acidimicrobiia bacterium]
MNCDEFRAAVLAGDEDGATGAHVDSCAACRSQATRLREMRDALGTSMLWEEPSPELGDQIEALIASSGESPKPRVTPMRRWWVGVVSVAAVIVIVSLVGSALAMRHRAPDWEVALPATDLAPNAVATVSGWNEDAGTRMMLAVSGLDPAPRGYIYEFWLSQGSTHVSAGTFHSGGHVELWAGVRRGDFPRMWVTLEPLDEDAGPSTVTMLDTGYTGFG